MINPLLTSQELDSLFMNYCLEGDLDNVKILWDNCDPKNIKRWAEEGLNQAAFWGRQNVVDFFIEENKEKKLYYNYSNAFMAACCNSFEMVQHLAKRVDIHDPNELYLPFACKCDQLDIVKFLLESNGRELINAHCGQALLYALEYRNWEIVDYLLSNEADIHIEHDAIFKSILKDSASSYYRKEIIQKLVFDYDIVETDDIKDVIKETKSDWANSLFRSRELYGTLETELAGNKTVKKAKI